MCGTLAGGPHVSPHATGLHCIPVYYHYPHFNLTWSNHGPEGRAEDAVQPSMILILEPQFPPMKEGKVKKVVKNMPEAEPWLGVQEAPGQPLPYLAVATPVGPLPPSAMGDGHLSLSHGQAP